MQQRANLVGTSRSRTLFVFALCVVLSVLTIVGFPGLRNSLADGLLRGLLGLGLAILLIAYVYGRYLRLKKSGAKSELIRVDGDQAYKLQRSAGWTHDVSFVQAKIFALAVVAPAELRQRLIETYNPSPRALRHTLTINAHIRQSWLSVALRAGTKPANGGDLSSNQRSDEKQAGRMQEQADDEQRQEIGFVLFPALVPPKGELSDNFELRDAAGQPVPVLSHREYLQLVATVLRTLLTSAYQLKSGQTLEAVQPQAVAVEHEALMDVVKRGAGIQTPFEYSGAEKLSKLRVKNGEVLSLAVKLVEKLSTHYAVVAAVPIREDGRFVLTFERTVVPTLDLAGSRGGLLGWAKGWLRVLFGARPVSLTFDLENAWTCRSYHLFVHSEEGLYLGAQKSRTLANYVSRHGARPSPSTIAPPYYRFRRRLGQSYAHFYSRFFPEPRLEEGKRQPERVPSITFQFYERPPGSVFRAAVAAVACVLLVWLVGFLAERIDVSKLQTDAPAVLLAFPAVAAAWLGFDQPTRRLLEGTLVGRTSLALTAIVSILASGLFMADQGGAKVIRETAPLHMAVFGIHAFAWCGLVLIALLNAAVTTFIYLLRSWDFVYLASRENSDAGIIDGD